MGKVKSSATTWILVVVLVIVAAVGGYFLYKNNSASADVATTSIANPANGSYITKTVLGANITALSFGSVPTPYFKVKVVDGSQDFVGKTFIVYPDQLATFTTATGGPISIFKAGDGMKVGKKILISANAVYNSSHKVQYLITDNVSYSAGLSTPVPTPTPSYDLTFACTMNGVSCLNSPPDGSTINVGDEITVTATWPQTPTGTLKATPAPDNAGIQLTTVSHTANSLTVKIKGFKYSNPDFPSSSGNTYHINFWAGTQQYRFFQVGVNQPVATTAVTR